MTKVMCATPDSLPRTLDNDVRDFSLFKSAGRQRVGNIARGWKGELNRSGFAPDAATWDFVQFLSRTAPKAPPKIAVMAPLVGG